MERTVVSQGRRVRYLTRGSGRAVVLLHGFSQSSDSWTEAGVLEALASRFKVVSIDRLGHGGSDSPADVSAYDEGAALDDISSVLAVESIDNAALWGFSLGAKSAMSFAIREPERVWALVQGSAPPLDGAKLERFFTTVDGVLEEHGLGALYASLGVSDPERIAHAVEVNDDQALRRSLAGSLGDVPDPRSLSVPWLYYYGSAERPGPASSDLDAVADNAGEVHVIEGAGHLDCFDRSVSDALGFVMPFLDEHLAT